MQGYTYIRVICMMCAGLYVIFFPPQTYTSIKSVTATPSWSASG